MLAIKYWCYALSFGIFITLVGVLMFNKELESIWGPLILGLLSMLALILPRFHKPFELPKKPQHMTPSLAMDLIKHLHSNYLPKDEFIRLVQWSIEILKLRDSLVYIPTHMPVTIVGDLHGQYDDLNQILSSGISHRQLLFNGDYVDRGTKGIEILTALMACLCSSPHTIYLSRGNHEDPSLHMVYGFQMEVFEKYDEETYDIICELFKTLPYAHVIGSSIFVVHGGLPPERITLNNIKELPRGNKFIEDANIPSLAYNLLWSDPQNMNGCSKSSRGIGCLFGPDITKQFLDDNNLCLIVRSHEVKLNGFQWTNDGKVLTIFSASNYGNCRNEAAIANVTFLNNTIPHVDVLQLKKSNNPTPPVLSKKFLFQVLALVVLVGIDLITML
ncbi:Serine/threonine protein phosphatase type 5 [Entamoeba marina]